MEPKSLKKFNLLNSQNNSKDDEFNKEIKDTEILSAQDLRIKAAEIISKSNTPQAEHNFRKISSFFENSPEADPILSQAYQDYKKAYHHSTSLYHIFYEEDRGSILLIYNTESERNQTKILKIIKSLTYSTCIAPIPNGELFCLGSLWPRSGTTIIIDLNAKTRKLPSGVVSCNSSAIYLNKAVYSFGRELYYGDLSDLSCKFDLDRNRWIKLASMPNADKCCYCVLFNENILISGQQNKNLLLYSVDINSFSTIPYDFKQPKVKLLIKSERIHLIEFGEDGWIYESEIGDCYNWKKNRLSIFNEELPSQISYVYNKGEIYIGFWENYIYCEYWKFNLDTKIFTKLQIYYW